MFRTHSLDSTGKQQCNPQISQIDADFFTKEFALIRLIRENQRSFFQILNPSKKFLKFLFIQPISELRDAEGVTKS